MSPNEAQLRAALREGADGRVDADLIIAGAERHRRARRQRISYAAAAVVVAAVVGVGVGLLAGSGSGDEAGGGSVATDNGGTATSAVGAAGGRAAPPAAQASTAPHAYANEPGAATCPPPPARVVVPVRPGAERTQLLPERVSTITACSYRPGTRTPSSVVLDGVRAQGLATALNGGSVRPAGQPRSCPSAADRAGRVALLATGADGRPAKTVLVTVRCSRTAATNGAATRYLDTVPPELSRVVR